jgi:hypothetical protein
MHKAQLLKNIGQRVRFRPIACRLDQIGQELPQIDDEWLIISEADNGIVVANIRTQHQFTLGFDHVHHYTSDTTRHGGGVKFGFLTLLVQVFLQDRSVKIEPTKPGERVAPPEVNINERLVDFDYPTRSGLKGIFDAQNLKLQWVLESRLHNAEFAGWTRVIMRLREGAYEQYRVKDRHDDQVLVWQPGFMARV